MAIKLGFGYEIETESRPKKNSGWTAIQQYAKLAKQLSSKGIPAISSTSKTKYPPSYKKWWIANDSSIKTSSNTISMECVSTVQDFDKHVWESEVKNFWAVLLSLFEVKKNFTAGTHIHVAPWGKPFSLKQAQIIAFACCYYEPYVISLMPKERRDYKYCQRNTQVAGRMAILYKQKKIHVIASDIKKKGSLKSLCTYMQGGVDSGHRRVMWNFQGLLKKKTGTIEFRGGRHMRGPGRTIRWITFVVVFVMLAIKEDLLHSTSTYHVPNNDIPSEVQEYWKSFLDYAQTLGVKAYLPSHFKMMSEKRKSDR